MSSIVPSSSAPRLDRDLSPAGRSKRPSLSVPNTPEASFLEVIQRVGNIQSAGSGSGDLSKSFGDLIAREVGNVNEMQLTADANVHELLTGGDVNEAEVLTSVQKADLAFRMLLQVRNKLIEAYREIQQIQI